MGLFLPKILRTTSIGLFHLRLLKCMIVCVSGGTSSAPFALVAPVGKQLIIESFPRIICNGRLIDAIYLE